MNDARRNSLQRAIGLLDQAYDIASNAKDEELDGAENLPDNFWDKKEQMEAAADSLEEALDSILEAKSSIEEVVV